MKPFLIALALLLGASVFMTALGMALLRARVLRERQVARLAFLSVLLLTLLAAALGSQSWPGLHLRGLNFWSFLLVVAMVTYGMVSAGAAYMLNRTDSGDFGDSHMLSMLYTHTELAEDFPPTTHQDTHKASGPPA